MAPPFSSSDYRVTIPLRGLTESSVSSSNIINGTITGSDISATTITDANIQTATITESKLVAALQTKLAQYESRIYALENP
jgi:hypothetical protein